MAANKYNRVSDRKSTKYSASITKNTNLRGLKNDAYHGTSVTNAPETKWIQVYVNGDEHFSGYRCVINSKYYRSFDVFLNHLTERLQPSFGAVRNIYTPINGHSIHSIEDLMPNQKYVVAGSERFKRLEPGYADIGDKSVKRTVWKPKSKYKVSKAKPLCHYTLNINFYKNGNFKMKPCKLVFHIQDLENWDGIFQKVSETLKCSPIKRLCSLNGKPVRSIEELVNNQAYVVIGKHEVFKNGTYGNVSHKNFSSTREKNNFSRQIRKPSSVIHSRSSAQSRSSVTLGVSLLNYNSERTSLVGSAKLSFQQLDHSSFSDKSESNNNSGDEYSSFENKGKESFEERIFKDDFIARVKEVDLDDDFSGIYRAKTQNHLTVGAVEIDDDTETAVDLPIDLLEAEEVEDEMTPDMERSLQHLSLDVPEEIVAFLPSMQKKQSAGNDRQVSANKYNLSHSQTLDIRNIFV